MLNRKHLVLLKDQYLNRHNMTEEKKDAKFAAILIRGRINIRTPIKDTLDMLKLFRRNYCIIIKNKELLDNEYRQTQQSLNDLILEVAANHKQSIAAAGLPDGVAAR